MTVKLGLMVPANNTTMEPELLDWLPGAQCRTLRIPRGKGLLGPAEIPAYVAQALELARDYDPAQTDIVAYGCTAAGFIGGPVRDAEIQTKLAAITGKPVVTTASAMIEALRHIGAQRIAVVTPYLDLINERLCAYLEQSGITVLNLASFKAETTDELAAITPEQIAVLARKTMTPDADALFIACSQLPTRDIMPRLEREFGKPVWSSIKATAWHAEQMLTGKTAAALPDVPPIAEQGVKGYELTNWFGLVVPAATPKDLIARIHGNFTRVLQEKDIRDRIAGMGADVVANTPEQFAAFWRNESKKWGRVILEANIRAE